MKKVLVTGANGFIGRSLVKQLLHSDYLVYAVVKGGTGLRDISSENLRITICEFSDYSELADRIGERVDTFIHLAWDGYGKDTNNLIVQSKNILASTMALEQAQLLGASRFIFAGSSYQYRMEPITKDDNTFYIKKNIYGSTKEAATTVLRAASGRYGIIFNSVLFTNVFGVGDHSNRSTNTLILQLLQHRPIRLIPGNHKHDWTYIDDAVNGIISVMENGKDGARYYIGNRQLKTFQEIMLDVQDVVCPDADLQFGCYPDDGYIDYSEIDLESLYRETGFVCKADFRESIRKTAQWLIEQKAKESVNF